MRIAIPYVKDGGQIGEQFDSAENVKLYNLEGDRIVSELVIPSFGRKFRNAICAPYMGP